MTINFDNALAGYMECAEWADCGPDQETEGKDWSEALHKRMQDDVRAFIARVEGQPSLTDALAAVDYSDERFGHDFWLTRNRHGAGFWDRKELEADGLGERLTDLAHAMGECELYVGDDGEVYA